MFNNNANTSSSLSASINLLLSQWKWQFKDQNSPFSWSWHCADVIALVCIHLTRDPSACACVCARLTFDQAILLPFFLRSSDEFRASPKRKRKELLIAAQCYACVTLKVNIHNINSLCHLLACDHALPVSLWQSWERGLSFSPLFSKKKTSPGRR